MPRLDFAYAGIKFKSSYFNMVLKGDYKNMINNERLSGILLHPTSLPSPYGIGDLGDEAYAFIDFLARAGQHLRTRVFLLLQVSLFSLIQDI